MLRKRLYELPPGHVQEVDEVAALLAGCWQFFSGARAERMHAGKLQRMEDLQWDPPVLSFTIERHGGMGMGSTRAELQNWRVDLNRRTARSEDSRSYRQVLPRAEGVKVEPLAAELVDAIAARRPDKRLRWQKDETVRVLMAEIFPHGSGFKQTVRGRRNRLRAAMNLLLVGKGWQEVRQDVYRKAGG